MIRFLVNRPVAVLISFLSLMLLGITAFLHIPVSLLPDTNIPQMIVKVKGANYAAKEVEQYLTSPIRNTLMQSHGLEQIESTSSEGSGIIRLVFEHGLNSSMSFVEVNEKVDLVMNQLPKDVERPIVTKSGVGDIAVFNLNVYPKDEALSTGRLTELSNFAREVLRRRVEHLPEVALVDVTGLAQPRIQLMPKTGYLQSLGLNYNILLQAFRENKINLGNIMVKDGHYQYYLKFSSELQSLSAIENTPLNIQGRLFKLKDLVTVSYTNAPESGSFFSNGRPAINFAVIKQTGARMEDLKESFDQLMVHFKKDYPDLRFEISEDQTKLLDYSVNNLQQDLILGGGIAFLLMLVFIRKIRSALLIAVTIPLSLLITQLGFYLTGISINIISLGGLILGLGMIIDNSIVVIDNINRHKESGLDLTESTIRGTNEIIRPLITSVLTNCSIFIPIIFMSGLAGAIFYDQALSITIGVLASLLVSVVLLPPLYKLIYSTKKVVRKPFEITARVNVTGWYEYGLKKVFNYPKLTCLAILLLFVGAILLFNSLPKDRLPPITRYDTEILIDWNENISIEENAKRIATSLGHIRNDIIESNTWVGSQQYLLLQGDELGYTQSKIYIRVRDANRLLDVQKKLASHCAQNYPTALIAFSPAKNAFDAVFSNAMAPIRLNLSDAGKNGMPEIVKTGRFLESLRLQLPHIQIDPVALYTKIILQVNAEQAALYDVSIADIGKQIEAAFKPVFVDNFQKTQILVPIVLVNATYGSVNEMLAQTFIPSKGNVSIPLSYLVNMSQANEYKYITAGTEGKYYPVDIYTHQPEIDLPIIRKLVSENSQSLEVEYKGGYFENLNLIKEMSVILLVSILLLYFILAAQFESLVQPLFILIELPIALSGAFIFLYLAGNSINLMSMIGIVVMSGLIINDSILKIDAINQLRRQGMPLMEAIHEGGHKRLKPIIMISLTSIGSLLPTLFMNDLGSELQKPLALALIGGMFIGLFVSLFFVPLLYWFVYRKNK